MFWEMLNALYTGIAYTPHSLVYAWSTGGYAAINVLSLRQLTASDKLKLKEMSKVQWNIS